MPAWSKTWIVSLALLLALPLAVLACGGGDSGQERVMESTAVPAETQSTVAAPTTQMAAPTEQTAPPATQMAPPATQMAAPTEQIVVQEGAFKIGVMESLTGPGETYGTVAVQAKQMAVEELNAAGGINGRMLEMIVEDSKCNAQDSITAYKKLTDVDEVKIILGTSCSGAMLGAAPLAEKDGVVLFSGLATNPDIANAGDYIFRTSMSDAQWVLTPATSSGQTESAIWPPSPRPRTTPRGSGAPVSPSSRNGGGKVVGEERYASDVTDFRTQLTKLLNDNPDGLHVAAQSEFTGGTIVKQVRELGYEGAHLLEVVPIGATALEIAGDAATGMKAITADLDPANNKAREVLANFRSRYDYITLPWYLGSAYDDVYIAAECLKKTGDDQDADGFRDCLYEITWSGAIGDSYSFDQDGEVVGLANAVVQVLPTAERTEDNQGYKVLGGAPTQ